VAQVLFAARLIANQGGRTEDTIVPWINKRLGPASKTLSQHSEIDIFVNDNKVSVIGFFHTDKDDGFMAFEAAASSFDDVSFAHIVDAAAGLGLCG
jgi:hypothetical protein